jgi:hypothetical protein
VLHSDGLDFAAFGAYRLRRIVGGLDAGGLVRWRAAIVLMVGVVGVLAASQPGAPSAASTRRATLRTAPVTLFNLPHRILDFSQDGSRIAYALAPCGAVTIRSLVTGLQYGFHGPLRPCGSDSSFESLAFDGARATWIADWVGLELHQNPATGVVGGVAGGVGLIDETSWSDPGLGGGTVLGLAAADGTTVYSYLAVGVDDNTLHWLSETGGVYDVRGKKIPGLAPAAAIAVGEGLIADAPVDPDLTHRSTSAALNARIDIYDTRTRTMLAVQASGRASSLAISRAVLAVLVHVPDGSSIERFDPATGVALGTTSVSRGVSGLAVSGKRIVYTESKRIWLLDAVTGRRRLLVTAAAAPIGLSIEGTRVFWAEIGDGQGRIVAAEVR